MQTPAIQRTQRLIHLDVVRGVAILMVLGQHTPAVVRLHPVPDAVSEHLHRVGHLGVDLFFVLSGFLIGGLLFAELGRRRSIDVRRFLVRRAFKIWPAYLVCLTACCVVSASFGRELATDPHPLRTVFGEMWPAYFHVQNYFPSTGRFALFWSLAVEEHFYLVLPVVLLLACGRRAADAGRVARVVAGLAIGTAVVCLALRALRTGGTTPDGYTHYFPTHLRIDSLMAGVFLAAVTAFAPGAVARYRPWRWGLGVFAIAVFVLPAALPGGDYYYLYPFDCSLVTLGSMAMVLLAYFADTPAEGARRPSRNRLLGWSIRALAFVGFYSYSIYLWHGYFAPPLTNRLVHAVGLAGQGRGWPTVMHLMAYLSVAVVLGVAGYYLIERPFLAIRERLLPRPVSSSLPPTRPSTDSRTLFLPQ